MKFLSAYTSAIFLVFLIIASGVYADNLCVCNKSKLTSRMDSLLRKVSLDEPISIALKQNSGRIGLLGHDIERMVLGVLTKYGIACVEVKQDSLNRILEEIYRQSNGMFNPDTSVDIGHWASAKYLGIIDLEEKISGQKISFTFKVTNLETRVHTFIKTIDFCVENCSQKHILDNLPEPSPGGQDTLSDYEKM